MKKYGVALIGCGQMGAVHIEHIYYKENVSIECVCDVDKEKAEEFRRRYNAKRVETDFEKCIESPDVDIVIIATYPSTHLKILEFCIKNKKHVICEKPIATNYEDGKRVCELVKENPDCKILIGHILRHNAAYNKVRDMIKSGAIGFPVVMRMAQNHHTMRWHRYLNLINETSPVVDCGVHYIDVMRWVTGEEVTDIFGIGARTEADVPKGKYNYGLITMKFSGGSIGYYEVGWSNTMSSDNLKEFVGPKGRIKLIFKKDRVSNKEEGDLIEYYKYPEKKYEIINVDGDRRPADKQFDCLIDMIESDSPPNPSIDDVFRSFEIAIEADNIIMKNL